VLVQQAASRPQPWQRNASAALPRRRVTILITEWSKPFSVDGYSGWIRDATIVAGLPLDSKPHGLRKTLGACSPTPAPACRRSWPL
jgi:hypothetical protein